MDKKTLIVLVQNKPHLWDVNDKDYNNPTKCMETWTEISKELNLDGGQEQAKREWEQLRDMYLRNKNESTSSSVPTSDCYRQNKIRKRRSADDDPMSPQYPHKVVTITENGKTHTTHTTAQTSMYKNGVSNGHHSNNSKTNHNLYKDTKVNVFNSSSSTHNININNNKGLESLVNATKYATSSVSKTSTSFIYNNNGNSSNATSDRFKNYRDSSSSLSSLSPALNNKKNNKTHSIDMIFSRMRAQDQKEIDVEEKSLIVCVEDNPHLWDVNRTDYGDEKKCKETWFEISDRLGMSGPDHAREAWERIRNAYMRVKTLQHSSCPCCASERTSPTNTSYVQAYGRISPPSTTYTKTYTEKYEVYSANQRDVFSSTSETAEEKGGIDAFLVRQTTDNVYVNIDDTEERYSPPHLMPQTSYYPRTLASEKYLSSRRNGVKRVYRETDEKETIFGDHVNSSSVLHHRQSPQRALFKNHLATMCDTKQ